LLTWSWVAANRSQYREAIEYLKTLEPHPKALSSEPYIENLYTENRKDIVPCPTNVPVMQAVYKKGYHYLILDPQAYISWTADGQRFTQKLEGPLEFARQNVKPIKVFDNFNDELLTQFAYEHNQNLSKTSEFLNNRQEHFGQIRIYDIKDILDKLVENANHL